MERKMSNKKIYKYRKFGIRIVPGNPNSKFSVTSSDEIAKQIINPKSEIWQFRKDEAYFIDFENVSFNYIHEILNKKNKVNKELITITIKNQGLLHKASNLLGKKIDLSLSEENRYPTHFYNLNNSKINLGDYILEI